MSLCKHRFINVGIFFLVVSFAARCHALSITAGPYLQNPSETSMTIMWMTDAKCTSWVEYGTGDTLDQKAIAAQHGLIDANQTIHRITISGLTAGRQYKYRICSREIIELLHWRVTYGETVTSDVKTFTTLSRQKQNISFIVLNDIHQDDSLMVSLLEMSASRPYDLVFLNGDILGHIQDEPQIVNHVLKPCSRVFASHTPFIWVRGNHETRGAFARMLPNYITLSEGRYYGSFDHGPVHFLVMDGGEDKNDDHREYSGLAAFDPYREEQTVWLRSEIKTDAFRNARFRVVIVNMPPLPMEPWHGPTDLHNKWRPLFNEAKVERGISAHTHAYTVMKPQEGLRDYPMVIGGGNRRGQATVIRVDATPDKLDVVMTRDDGEIVGRYSIDAK